MGRLTGNQRFVAQLLALRGRMHGWAIYEALQGVVASGSIYGTLTTMEKRGLLAAEWVHGEGKGNPSRKYFDLTAQGHQALADEQQRERDAARALRRRTRAQESGTP